MWRTQNGLRRGRDVGSAKASGLAFRMIRLNFFNSEALARSHFDPISLSFLNLIELENKDDWRLVIGTFRFRCLPQVN